MIEKLRSYDSFNFKMYEKMRTITTKWVILNDFTNSEFKLIASARADCVVPENIHAPLHGRSLEILKRRVQRQ